MALVLAGGVFAGYVSLAIHGEEEKEINIGSIKVDSWPYGAWRTSSARFGRILGGLERKGEC